MRKVIALVWIGLLIGALVVTPVKANPEKVNWWANTYNGPGDCWIDAMPVAIAPNGDIIVAGGTHSPSAGGYDAFVMRLSQNGTVIWAKTYGGKGDDVANAIAIAPNGDIIVAGYTESFGAGNGDAWVLRLDENGNVKWQKTYGGKGDDRADAVAITGNGDIIVAGYTESFGAGGRDAWVLRLDENGNVKWQKTYGGSSVDEAHAVAIAENGDIIVAGYTWSFGAGGAWVLRLDANGNVKWQKTYGGKGDMATAVAIAPNGDIIITTWWGKLVEFDEDGDVIWQKIYVFNIGARAVAITPNNDIIVAGIGDDDGIEVLRLPLNGKLPGCRSGCPFFKNSNYTLLNTNAIVKDSNVNVKIPQITAEYSHAIVNSFTLKMDRYYPDCYLHVSSSPMGAKVYVNGTYKGNTPVTINLYPGIYNVTITKSGYNTFSTIITLPLSSYITISPALKPITSTQIGTQTTSITQTETSTGYMIGSETIPGFQPSQEYLKNVSAYAIQKAEELITNLTSMGYQVLYAKKYLDEAKNAYNNGDYKTAKELALKAWITALKEWQIQYEAEILKKAGIDPSQALQEYRNGNLDGAINELNSLASDLNGEYAKLFNSVKSTFDTIQFYWKSGIRLWNYVDDLYSSNEKFKSGELEVAKNLADKALNTVRDIGSMARQVLKQLVSLGRSVYSNGRNTKAQELFEHAMSLFEQGKFDQAKKVIVQIQEVITVTTTKSGGICGPALIVLLAAVPLFLRKRR